MSDIRFFVNRYLGEGRVILPVKRLEKATRYPKWSDPDVKPGQDAFADDVNIAERLDVVTDVDCDSIETRALAPRFLLGTGRVHGRPSLGASHYWYSAPGSKYESFTDLEKKPLVEIRTGNSHYTLIPPSILMSKGDNPVPEQLTWERDTEPGKVNAKGLRDSVVLLATCAMLARYWPSGGRHNTTLAIAGTLCNLGVPAPAVLELLKALTWYKEGEEWSEVDATVSATFAAQKAGEPFTGSLELAKLIENGEAVVKRIRAWYGVKKKEKASDDLIGLVDGATLFHRRGDRNATYIQIGNRTYTIDGDAPNLLRDRRWAKEQKTISDHAIKEAVLTLHARARAGDPRDVYKRIARLDDEIFIDLGDDGGTVVHVTSRGWAITESSPVAFVRYPGMLPLPEPSKDGDLQALRPLVNLSDDDYLLAMAFVLGVIVLPSRYVNLSLVGEEQTAKSRASQTLKNIIDPSGAADLSIWRNEAQLAAQTLHGFVLRYENLSRLSQEESDYLCKISDGSSFGLKTLYETAGLTIVPACQPVMMTSRKDVVKSGDLISRTIVLRPEPIPPGARKEDRDLDAVFTKAHPLVLGALCDVAVRVLRNARDTSELKELPRRADFARALYAWDKKVLELFLDNQRRMRGVQVGGDIVGRQIRRKVVAAFTGTPSELLAQLEFPRPEPGQRWGPPSTPELLGQALRLVAPALRELGWVVDLDKRAGKGRKRVVQLVPPAKPGEPEDLDVDEAPDEPQEQDIPF